MPLIEKLKHAMVRNALIGWKEDWAAPCEDVTENGTEFGKFHVVQGSADRLKGEAPQAPKVSHAMRVQVFDGDQAWDTADGKLIAGGWRAEAIGKRIEVEGEDSFLYKWSTMLSLTYPGNPHVDAPENTDPKHDRHGEPVWQVIFQWHQWHTDRGVSPPVEFIIVGDEIKLSSSRPWNRTGPCSRKRSASGPYAHWTAVSGMTSPPRSRGTPWTA